MSLSLTDFQDFVLLWIQKRTGVHQGDLVLYPAMVRHCLCCHASGMYADRTSGLCQKCSEAQTCVACSDTFAPSEESVGVFCPKCWLGLESAWRETFEEGGQIRAEAQIRARIIAARPRLSGCQHRA